MLDLLDSDFLIRAYKNSYFPMAESESGEIYMHSPEIRAIFPIYDIKTPKNIIKLAKRKIFRCTINYDFEYVIRECANREITWINDIIIESYINLHKLKYAHSIETWKDNRIVGGLYGVSIGGAFFGESMFYKESDASKFAFYFLVEYLRKRGFLLLDSQYINKFTQELGAIEIPKVVYLKILEKAINLNCSFVD
ncbi:MAG: leucyl/phenylalanyl-tRNA--protein transferase [Candidatus Kapabacteria bacterium]|nr:leucyl/phenylalanyl-tRNA--protein transferase [Candidatus Kapabacteria bacterium]